MNLMNGKNRMCELCMQIFPNSFTLKFYINDMQGYIWYSTCMWVHVCMYTFYMSKSLYNVECIFFVARGFVVRTRAIKHLWHSRHASHEQTHHVRTFS